MKTGHGHNRQLESVGPQETDRIFSYLPKFVSKGIDEKLAILLATVRETIFKARGKGVSVFGLEKIVAEKAAKLGATGELLAAFVRHLPNLYIEVRTADMKASEADVSLPAKPQYEIWTGGRRRIVKDISQYRDKESQYLFWIDLSNNEHKSLGEARPCLKSTALKLLLFLCENIGVSIPRAEVFERVWEERVEEGTGWRNLLHQYITQLDKFAARGFRRSYLVHDRLKDTLCLKESFKPKYFIFSTLRSPDT